MNIGAFLTYQFEHVAKKNDGLIVIGGLITPIAMETGIELDSMEEARENARINMEVCRAMHIITKVAGGYLFLQKDGTTIQLPNPALKR